MNTFLNYIAKDIIKKYGTNLSRIAVVFPNKRASLFLNEELARLSDKPIWSPAYITISDLFRRHSNRQVGDPIKLICDLYKVFTLCTGSEETLDEFYGWGQLLIADFDDIDKNMADAKKVFANLKDIHELDDVSYLSDDQREMLKKFFSNFSEDHDSELKRRFLSLWSHFYKIYDLFNERLTGQGIAYEGALYRQVVEMPQIDFEYDTYLFVGFNMMQKVELSLCDRLMKEGKAKFYWDFDDYYIHSEAGTYIRQYLLHYPNELDNHDAAIYQNFSKAKKVTFVDAATENIQARYVSDWLKTDCRYEDGRNTAVVMADEKLLNAVIHSLPDEIKNVNVTTGYPLAQAPVSSFVNVLIQLQTIGRVDHSDRYRLHEVNMILRHPYICYMSDNSNGIFTEINEKHRKFYPSRRDLSNIIVYDEKGNAKGTEQDEGLSLLFCDIDAPTQKEMALKLCNWLGDVLQWAGHHIGENGDALLQESVFRTYTLINRLSGLMTSGDLDIDIRTFQRLLTQLIQSTSIPFHGEPVIGIQVMGILETRNLDFDHVLLLSCNEGNLPKGVNDASFIPYSIRKAYGLTTVDNKVAIFAYYFHSLLQRAGDVTLVYNHSTGNGQTGEMSRFMLQLLVESPFHIQQISLQAGKQPVILQPEAIEKDEITLSKLDNINVLSPTAINKFLRCPLSFFYRYIADIKEPDEAEEDQIDNRIFGNIFHRSAELFYDKFGEGATVQKDQIEEYLRHPEQLDVIVDKAFSEKLFNIPEKTTGFKPEYNGLQYINREVIIDYLKQLLKIDIQLAPFEILGLEKNVSTEMPVKTRKGLQNIKISGFIDRLDRVVSPGAGDRIRVIDYKTGNVPQSQVNKIEEIFATDRIQQRHSDYFLQSFLYALIVRQDPNLDKGHLPVGPALLFIQHAGAKDYDPTLSIGKNKVIDIQEYAEDYKIFLTGVLQQIYDPAIAFLPTEDRTRCQNCPYHKLCGK
ncbi:MAG TPA: nuclease [Prevotella sp.]|nr:nuclease [Prevotella sp.]